MFTDESITNKIMITDGNIAEKCLRWKNGWRIIADRSICQSTLSSTEMYFELGHLSGTWSPTWYLITYRTLVHPWDTVGHLIAYLTPDHLSDTIGHFTTEENFDRYELATFKRWKITAKQTNEQSNKWNNVFSSSNNNTNTLQQQRQARTNRNTTQHQ